MLTCVDLPGSFHVTPVVLSGGLRLWIGPLAPTSAWFGRSCGSGEECHDWVDESGAAESTTTQIVG